MSSVSKGGFIKELRAGVKGTGKGRLKGTPYGSIRCYRLREEGMEGTTNTERSFCIILIYLINLGKSLCI